ncbi:MAG: PBECR2 nuclease fold domain-containing protein [bacterium]
MAGNKDLVLETLEDPDIIVKDEEDTLIAIKHYLKTSIGEKDVAVVYKESKDDGFIITTFMTSKIDKIKSRGGGYNGIYPLFIEYAVKQDMDRLRRGSGCTVCKF